jgi:tetratricopeptide (TPR) repeat protein
MPRRPDLPPETLEERWQLEAQTARNLEAFDAEREGRLDDAIALYELNVAESFPGDLPYGRLVAIYERAADLDAAERVLRRAIAVFESSTRRTPQDRRATLRVFQRRLKLLEQQRRAASRAIRKRRSSAAPSKSAPE